MLVSQVVDHLLASLQANTTYTLQLKEARLHLNKEALFKMISTE
tara:strand:+ start:856 stop:987 length:132 start_codon:yes stop_codon:yes gene_type:complete